MRFIERNPLVPARLRSITKRSVTRESLVIACRPKGQSGPISPSDVGHRQTHRAGNIIKPFQTFPKALKERVSFWGACGPSHARIVTAAVVFLVQRAEKLHSPSEG